MRFIEDNFKGLVLLLLLISVVGGVAGYRYYSHTQEDPEFCMSCHMMQESIRSWQKSKHRDILCQDCHSMNILEQNRMLVAFVVKGDSGSVRQKHGRVSPWTACRECHLSEAAQGSVSLSRSYGHARHVFMENIGCGECHTAELHAFSPDERSCKGCHTGQMIHGLGMEGLSCLKCHSYSEKAPMMITNERCLRCHSEVPTKGTMAALNCFDCHHPHGKIQPSSQDCLKSCHGNEAKVGQHELHMKKANLTCLDCHKAHTWTVGNKEARVLCVKCHALKDPATFIY